MKLYYLTSSFYRYAISNLVEIEQKANRPYAMICIKIGNHLFAVPLRSNIQHPNCYVTARNADKTVKGIDYSKAVIITNNDLDQTRKVTIDNNEFNVLKGKDRIIAVQFAEYVKKYKLIIEKQNNNTDLFAHETKLIEYSTLQNYHSQLSI